jgi:hypothetical protein
MTKHLLRKLAAGVIGLTVATVGAQAQPTITGEISFSGGATLDGLLNTATAYTAIFGPGGPGTGDPLVNSGATYSYASVPVDTPVRFTPFTFNPAPASPFELWSFSFGGSTYSFDVTSVVVYLPRSSTFLNLYGNGTAHITGFAPTSATWSISDTGSSGPVFSFGNVVVVPEPSAAALVLVLGSITLIARRGGYRR